MLNCVKIKPSDLVEDPPLKYFSASQIKLYRSCKICWAAKYIDGIEKAQSFAAQKGKDLHTLLEKYLKEGTPIDPSNKYGRIILSGIQHLPEPGLAQVEEKFILEADSINYHGYIDFHYRKDSKLFLGDHKTTKSFKWALTEQQLKTDIQANLYSLYLMTRFKMSEIELRWIYYKTEGYPESRLVSVKTDLGFVSDQVTALNADANEMLAAIASGMHACDFEPSISGCKAFGECAIKDVGVKMTQKKTLAEILAEKNKPVTPVISLNPPEHEEENQVTIAKTISKNDLEVLKELADKKPLGEKEEKKAIPELYINAMPLHEAKIVLLIDLLKPVLRRISEEYNVTHYKFIQYDAVPAIATALDRYLSNYPLAADEVLITNTDTAEGRDTLEILLHHSDKKHRGLR